MVVCANSEESATRSTFNGVQANDMLEKLEGKRQKGISLGEMSFANMCKPRCPNI